MFAIKASGNETEIFQDNYANAKVVDAISKHGMEYWGLYKIVAISQVTFSNAFS